MRVHVVAVEGWEIREPVPWDSVRPVLALVVGTDVAKACVLVVDDGRIKAMTPGEDGWKLVKCDAR